MGMQVPKTDRGRLGKFIGELGFTAYDETANPAYRVFLKN